MWYQPIFPNRTEAGRYLASELSEYSNRQDVIVLALPRGGVPVAFEVARALNAPLDIFLVRKLGVPGQEELAFGAIASGGVRFLNDAIINALHLSDRTVEAIVGREQRELERRERLYRGDAEPLEIRGKTIIVVDDGLATGASMRVAVKALKEKEPKQIVVAVPVAAEQTCSEFEHEADVLCVCAQTPEPFYGVGMWYEDFSQTTDAEVVELLTRAATGRRKARQPA